MNIDLMTMLAGWTAGVFAGWNAHAWMRRRRASKKSRAFLRSILEAAWSRPEPETVETLICDRRRPPVITVRPRIPRDIKSKATLDEAPRFRLTASDFVRDRQGKCPREAHFTP